MCVLVLNFSPLVLLHQAGLLPGGHEERPDHREARRGRQGVLHLWPLACLRLPARAPLRLAPARGAAVQVIMFLTCKAYRAG